MGVFGGRSGAGGGLVCGEEVEEPECLEDDQFAHCVWERLLDSAGGRYLEPVCGKVSALINVLDRNQFLFMGNYMLYL